MKNHKKLFIIVIATILCTALLGSYLNYVDKGLSTSVTRYGKSFNKSFIKKFHFRPAPMTGNYYDFKSNKKYKDIEQIKKLDLNSSLNKKVDPKLKQIDLIIDDIEDIVKIGTPDGNIYGIGTPDGNIVGIGTPDGN